MKTPVRTLACGIAAAILIGAGIFAARADQAAVAPPEGSTPVLEVVADGVQIYTCDPKDGGFEWSFKAPEANLFDQQGRQVGTHFAGPTWKLDDGSEVVGEVVAKADAKNQVPFNGCCFAPRAIGVGHSVRASPISVARQPRAVLAPSTSCDTSHRAQQARMRYSARVSVLQCGKIGSGFSRAADGRYRRGGRTS